MTAADVIDQIKALDPQVRAKVFDLLLETETDQKRSGMENQAFERASARVLEDHAELFQKLAQ